MGKIRMVPWFEPASAFCVRGGLGHGDSRCEASELQTAGKKPQKPGKN